jgi:hypothetical protein
MTDPSPTKTFRPDGTGRRLAPDKAHRMPPILASTSSRFMSACEDLLIRRSVSAAAVDNAEVGNTSQLEALRDPTSRSCSTCPLPKVNVHRRGGLSLHAMSPSDSSRK